MLITWSEIWSWPRYRRCCPPGRRASRSGRTAWSSGNWSCGSATAAGWLDHIRIDPRCRRRGLAALAVELVRRTWSGYRWSTAPIERTTEALGFWHSVDWPGPLGVPDECRHLRGGSA
ncbi:hypothetical protein MOQ72_25695 [Saccharopolyspora sp. K220]|uniref:hypothetical protein n=1 Tax=Saccharopolyspora soli TaxID=2926618 RepID=UPI001F5A483D|nr:hypothetical protein [Saccharopolyspora soli]MCI2420848.1 hypothetical protein [Saccharopolyspora soli]